MRCLPFSLSALGSSVARAPALWLALTVAAPLALGGCEASPTPATTTPAVDTTTGSDAATDGNASADTAGADAGATDAAGADTLSGDSTASTDATGGNADTALQDTSAQDTGPQDTGPQDTGPQDTGPQDASVPDGGAKDGTSADTSAKDTTAADIQPSKCASSADCPKGFGDCQSNGCDTATGKCFIKIAPDGAACKVAGICGGSGTCQMGACAVTDNPCAPKACSPKPLKCGDTLTLEPSKFGASAMNVWSCTAAKLDGGEQVYALAAEATGVAAVALAGAATDAATLALIANSEGGLCNATTCAKAAQLLSLGLKAGQIHTLVVDTKSGLGGSLTLTVTCGKPPSCGDGTCSPGETCNGCPKDCGACPECGNGTCDPKTENCASCVADCGECKIATGPECTAKTTPGCKDCACEAAVCKMDSYCCQTAWDSACVQECTEVGGPMCTKPDACGDNDCGDTEDAKTCPQDCGDAVGCGDGKCATTETCSGCPLDCGVCPATALPVCGNGKCDTTEHCGTCPKDCGVCSTDCSAMTSKNTPGCPGCACEAEVCKQDSYCCSTAWDGICVSACMKLGQLACPKDTCGDGICSGTETCTSCGKDCGPCICGDGTCQSTENDTTCVADCVKCGDGKCSATENSSACPADCPVCGDGVCSPKESETSCAQDCIKCGDGKCSKPTESLQTCPEDCSIGCKNKCGKSSEDEKGKSCYCDTVCEQYGDCCADKKQFCP